MKKNLVSAAFGLIALLTVTSSFAAGKSGEKFSTLDKGTIVKDGNTTTAYNKNGSWVYTIERYTADNLPKNIFDIVKDAYGSYYVSGMEKISEPGVKDVFIVHMQDETSVKTVRVSHGETELIEDYVKG
jgi:hypothetical protein